MTAVLTNDLKYFVADMQNSRDQVSLGRIGQIGQIRFMRAEIEVFSRHFSQ